MLVIKKSNKHGYNVNTKQLNRVVLALVNRWRSLMGLCHDRQNIDKIKLSVNAC